MFEKLFNLIGAELSKTHHPTVERGEWHPQCTPPNLTDSEAKIVSDFSDLYYKKLDEGRGLHTIVLSWMGYEMFKCPMDLWIYQEMITWERPDLIVEVGTYKGGSALFLANILDLVDNGHILSIDIDDSHQEIRPKHNRIQYLTGSSTSPEVFAQVKAAAESAKNVLIILDGDHRCEQVIAELRLYNELIQPGGYLIVEDTNINGHPTYPEFGPGPWEAVSMFLDENSDFEPDYGRERFLLTMNPRGFLKKKPPQA